MLAGTWLFYCFSGEELTRFWKSPQRKLSEERMLQSAPPKLQENLSILSEEERQLIQQLLSENQQHLFASWDPQGINDDQKHKVLRQLSELDRNCAGGITGYLKRARILLAASRAGENPFEGWYPKIPEGVKLEPFTEQYTNYENKGLSHLGKVGFVLVAGGLGERLGYNGIKVELPVETVTHTTYLGYYCQQILAMQARYGQNGIKLPLAIMVSDDTEEKTIALLESNNYFGMERDQVTLMKQGKVPALMSNNAQIALSEQYEIDSKPHGHGDVHYLLHNTSLAKKWLRDGIEWVTFFQDTNGLAFFTLPAMLGVSVELGLEVNSLAVPRFAKQSVGAIAKLVREDGREMTINVEYNQLDPLLRSTISPEGDSNDPKTGHSPFPGNINQLLFRLSPYVEALNKSNGLMPEFVNPKYKDSSKTVFKKPTRLECMMQDYPRLLSSEAKVGFTMAPAWICYSPCKNNAADAAASIASGVPSASAYTAECEQYRVFAEMLRRLGASVEVGESLNFLGISGTPSPRIVFHPSFALFPHEVAEKVRNARAVAISGRSTLVVRGDVYIDGLSLDGSLLIDAVPNSSIIVNASKTVFNKGHEVEAIDSNNLSFIEKDRMRGYIIKANEVKTVTTHALNSSDFTFDGVNLIDAEALEINHRANNNSDSCCSFFNC